MESSKLTWRGNWKEGELLVEVTNPEDLVEALKKLESHGKISNIPQKSAIGPPKISGNVGPSDAVREVLGSQWGRAEPRTMKEIMEVLETNAIYFSGSSFSGVLTHMTKKGELRRPIKKGGKWAYILSS
jgi:hypothetical protein